MAIDDISLGESPAVAQAGSRFVMLVEQRFRYARAMKVVVPISAVLWVAAILTFAAYPIIFWSLALPNVVVTILMIWLDARIVSLGGEPYWKRRSGDGS